MKETKQIFSDYWNIKMVTFEAATKKLLYDMGHPLFLVTNNVHLSNSFQKEILQWNVDQFRFSMCSQYFSGAEECATLFLLKEQWKKYWDVLSTLRP